MNGKRPYRMGKRQAAVDKTKRRIIDAAVVEYQINGIEDTSMQAVARRADVAPGTVLYHYSTPDQLVEAVVEMWIEEMEAPSPESIDPSDPIEQRVATLVKELFGLYERSEVSYQVYRKSPDHQVLKRYETWWYENAGQMMARALGELATDPETMQVLSVLTDPGFRGTLILTGIQSDRATEIATQMAIHWLNKK